MWLVTGALAESPPGINPKKGQARRPFEPPSHITSERSPQNSRESHRYANKEILFISRTATGLPEREEVTETAILRATELQLRGQTCIALLDLKSAYDTVPRRHLCNRLRKILRAPTYSMVEACMVPSWISTIGDPEKNWFVVDRGVAQRPH